MERRRLLKPANLFLSENLTPMRSTIFYALRMMKKYNGSRVVGASSFNGKVSAWVKNQNANVATRIPVNCRDKLEEVSNTFAGAPLSQFVERWEH